MSITFGTVQKKDVLFKKELEDSSRVLHFIIMSVKSKDGQDRLAKALRDNLAKRKALLRAKNEQKSASKKDNQKTKEKD